MGKNRHKENTVKRILSICSLFFFAFGSMSYAADQKSGSVSFPDTVRVGTTSLPAGTYKLHWEAGSSDTQITLSGEGHRVTVPATISVGPGPDHVLEHQDGNTQVVDGFTAKGINFTLKTP